MRAVIQRVSAAEVTVAGDTVGRIGPGAMVLLCAMAGDDTAIALRFAEKIAHLRIFADEAGQMNRSLLDTGGAALIVSQFTLAADTRRGRRPSFTSAAPPEIAQSLTDAVGHALAERGVPVQTGVFGADMAVTLTNDGPVTLWLDTEAS